MKFAALIFIILFGFSAYAAQSVKVITDGAMVYKEADFDAPVIGYLRAGDKVKSSSKKFGPFYRIQVKKGVIGYISDVDVEPEEGTNITKKSKSQKLESKGKKFLSGAQIGLSAGKINFAEEFNGRVESESLTFFGVKFTKPIPYFKGPYFADTNLLYHSGYPEYYNSDSPQSRGKSGRILMYDLQLLYSLSKETKKTFWGYVGGGLAVNYSAFVVELQGSKKDLSDVEFGGILSGGVAYQRKKFSYKLEPKYYVMKSKFFAIIASVQYEF